MVVVERLSAAKVCRLTAAQQLGVDATPTFFVNGKKFDGAPTLEAFDKALSGAAEKS